MKTSVILSCLAASVLARPAVTTVTQAEFNALKRAAGFSLAAYANCTAPMNTKPLGIIDTAAHGFIVKDDALKQIIVSMRGTESLDDLDVDADAIKAPYNMPGSEGCGEGCSLHEGFRDTAATAIDYIMTTVKAAKAANPDYSIMVTGHSLGGAECVLVAVPLRRLYKEDVKAYCFASPRFATPKMATFIESFFTPGSLYRVTSTNDGVPRVLTPELGFRHTGREYWIQKEPATGPQDIVACDGPESNTCNWQYGASFDTFGINEAHLQYIVSFVEPTCDGGSGNPPTVDVTVNDN